MYPGRLVRFGESDAAVVAALQAALNEALVLHDAAALAVDPAKLVMNRAMVAAVKLFQARNVDAMGMPLKVDGKVYPNVGIHLKGAAGSYRGVEPSVFEARLPPNNPCAHNEQPREHEGKRDKAQHHRPKHRALYGR